MCVLAYAVGGTATPELFFRSPLNSRGNARLKAWCASPYEPPKITSIATIQRVPIEGKTAPWIYHGGLVSNGAI